MSLRSRCMKVSRRGDGFVFAISCEGVWQSLDQDMVENGTKAILGAESIVLQPAHFGASSLALKRL